MDRDSRFIWVRAALVIGMVAVLALVPGLLLAPHWGLAAGCAALLVLL